ncbi:polysaccharide deacetylase family protein [Ichthyenterobacterium sp. W332]|uniref:Polysaccharide deacetylase family protein n=1 Tax=Microcosmobacter mediterraneus TaxID=3075607 RepID=A0ABU2YI85_9FLAO|nr:polysaccharide deacetylase family protein [Ichthyenterobacterium sp. W332]MDT0557742.1 polysaccharide deacetylase family protein [Ichthyenterobacterium sp. W332]
MELIPAKTPKLITSLFPSYVWNIPTKENTIFLTFDDGPTPEVTMWTLDILKKFNAKATFFCIGSNIDKHPEIFQSIVNDDHGIGNHTYNHLKGWKTNTKTYIKDIEKTQDLINKKIRAINNLDTLNTKLFRPPYGKLIPRQGKALQNLNYKIIMWNVLSFDWDSSTSKEKCFDNIISNAKRGSIIVFHDSLKASTNLKYCLPKVLNHFSKMGYTFKSLTL